MATTWMKAIHKSGGIAAALDRSIDYVSNPEKTEAGELIDGYECDPFTAQSEILFAKRLYEQKTGRDRGTHDVIAYHIRMSFRPGEVTATQALELGRELAMRWTRGKHQFIVAAHVNTKNPHAHIIFNSVNLDCNRKYSDFKHSAIALRRVSDQICLEHGLSVIEKPGLSKGYNRHEYLGEKKPATVRDQLRGLIDSALPASKDLDGFLAALEKAGVEVKLGKQLAFKLPDGKKFTWQDTLGDDYCFEAIIERIAGKRIIKRPSTKPNLLIDIQAKLQQGYGAGFEHYAKIENLKRAARTLIYLQEAGLNDYTKLTEAVSESSARYHELGREMRSRETRMNEIKELQRNITTYKQTLEVYRGYRDSHWSPKYYNKHTSDILLHQGAKQHFDSLKLKKLPTMDALRQEYAMLATGNGRRYAEYKQARQKMIELMTAKQNVDTFLGGPRVPTKHRERGALER